MIKLIVAHAKNYVIGKDNVMPWHIKEELQHFKKMTINHAIVMGRSTFEGINKVLPDRTTYLLTRQKDFHYDHPNVKVVNDIKELVEKYKDSQEILFISGGATIYKNYFHYADELIISVINNEYEGDAFLDIDFSMYELVREEPHEHFIVQYYRKKAVK